VRADRPAFSAALLAALEQTGFLYYRRVERSFQIALQRCLAEAGLSAAELLRGSSPAEAAGRPWAAVETGVRREFLWEALQQVAARENTSLAGLIAAIDKSRGSAGLSSAVRVWILDYYRTRALSPPG
jgi:hypothetical protein